MRSPIELKTVYAIIGAIVFLFTAYHGLNAYLDARISAKMSNPIFLKELARNIRPSVVFDERGSIIADQGAMAHLQSIKVGADQKDRLTITITPNEFLGIEPVLQALDGNYAITAERGSKYDWVFHLSDIEVTLHIPAQRGPKRFMLELIRY